MRQVDIPQADRGRKLSVIVLLRASFGGRRRRRRAGGELPQVKLADAAPAPYVCTPQLIAGLPTDGRPRHARVARSCLSLGTPVTDQRREEFRARDAEKR